MRRCTQPESGCRTQYLALRGRSNQPSDAERITINWRRGGQGSKPVGRASARPPTALLLRSACGGAAMSWRGRRTKPSYTARDWRQWGRGHPELAALVAAISDTLIEMQATAGAGCIRHLEVELAELRKAVTQWAAAFAGKEARDWHQQFQSAVDDRLA